jgi:UDP-N-acetylmuramate: L-alanyl-gamma-D-glutamyl-meso-diaminopimelate ligase
MHIHILGICGTFMGGLAALAREAGHTVTGCDLGVYPPMSDQLGALGIELIEGFGADQMALNPDLWVIGNVVSRARHENGQPKFPLMEAILDSGARYTSGPQWLSEHILHNRHVMAVAGTHGKTTTTSMLAWILEQTGREPGFLVGGVPLNFGISARLGGTQAPTPGQGPLFVIEADEYDTAFFDKRSKFVHYRPRTAILNNLEFDHADIFDNVGMIERQFHHLVRTIPASGRVVSNLAEESLARVVNMGCWSALRTFGTTDADFTFHGEPHCFTVEQRAGAAAQVEWAITGVHNQLNALAAMAAAEHVGVSLAESARALKDFQNVRRRMEIRGTIATRQGPITVLDDFAHHPTAIRTTIDGLARQLSASASTNPGQQHQQRIVAVFEPRSNTMKTGAVKAQLAWSLEQADQVHCYAGGLGWNPAAVLASLGSKATTTDTLPALIDAIVASAQGGDHILCMSNGGFGGIHQQLLDRLKTRFA